MPSIKLEQFGGMLPAWDPHLLPNGQAANGTNVYPFSGALTGWRVPKVLRNLTNPAARAAYRIPVVTTGTANDTITVISQPLEGDTVQIGEMTYKFTAVAANLLTTPYTVLIGATPGVTAANLLAAVTLDQGKDNNQGVLYGNGTSVNNDVDNSGKSTATDNKVTFFAAESGTAPNLTPVAESTGGVRLSWATTPTFTGGSNAKFDGSVLGNSVWLEFLEHHTEVVKSPVVDDKFNRFYWASPSQPPQYNTYDRIVAGLPPWLLGLNPPGCAPTVTVTEGGNSATLGLSTSVSANTWSSFPNQIYVIPVTPTQNMTLADVSIMPAQTLATAQYSAVIFGDTNGKPDLLLGAGNIITGATAGTPIVSSFTVPVGVDKNTQYWIGFMSDTQTAWQLADDNNNIGGVAMLNTWTNGPPGVFTVEFLIPDIQVWGTFTTASVIESRAYLYTWVTEYGEESAASPSTIVTGWSNGIWDITMWAPPAEDMGVLRNIKTARLYRTVPGTTGQTVFYWVCDLDLATNTITNVSKVDGVLPGTVVPVGPGQVQDTQGDDVIALNNQLQSTNWFPPPQGLQGMWSMPNGMIVGFKDNEFWFCEPYNPHAWPPGYVLTSEFPIVGMQVAGYSVVAATGADAFAATGVNPNSMGMTKIDAPSCLSRGSVVSNGSSVLYQSQYGLIEINPNQQTATNLTDGWITREKWMQLTPQKNLHACTLASAYFAFAIDEDGDTSVAGKGFYVELDAGDGKGFSIWPQPGGHRIGFMPMTDPVPVTSTFIRNLWNDPWSNVTMTIQNGAIYYYDFSDPAPTIQVYDWTSKIYQQKAKDNFAAMRVFFSVPPGTAAQNPTRLTNATTDPIWNTLPADRYGFIYVYADGNLVTVREIRSNAELLRIASGFKVEEWQFRVQARVAISNIQVATSVKELRNV